MPTFKHQLILGFVYRALFEFVTARDLGWVVPSGLRVHVREGGFRDPDVVFMSKTNKPKAQNRFWEGADLIVEVVSSDDKSHRRDWRDKRREYADAGVKEYWVVDPEEQRIAVLRLDAGEYVSHVEVGASGRVESALLSGFAIEAAELWDAGRF
jgi:Uma2 family endonuclease